MGKKIFISLLLFIFSYGAWAVSVKQYLFSDMTGVVNLEGQPVAGVKLVRMVDYNKKEYDETVTDKEGRFHFPTVARTSILSKVLPTEFIVLQSITAHHNDKEYEMWSGTKTSPKENAESQGKPLIVECELSWPDVKFISVDGNLIYSRCTWDVEPDKKESISYF